MAKAAVKAEKSKQQVFNLPIESLVLSPLNARKTEPDEDYIQNLAADIMANGQLQPGLVRPAGKDTWEIIFGGCRYRALKLANELRAKNEEPIPFRAYIVDRMEDDVAMIRSVAENFRQDINVVDKALMMQQLMEAGKSRKQVSEYFHVSPAQVTQLLKVLKLGKKVQRAASRGELPTEAALIIASIEDKAEQEKVFEDAVNWQTWLDESAAAGAVEEEEAAEAATEDEAPEAEAKPKKTSKKAKTVGKKGQKVSTAAVKKAVEKHRGPSAEDGKPRTRKQFQDLMDALNTSAASKAARDLMRALTGWFNGDLTDQRLANAFDRNCKED